MSDEQKKDKGDHGAEKPKQKEIENISAELIYRCGGDGSREPLKEVVVKLWGLKEEHTMRVRCIRRLEDGTTISFSEEDVTPDSAKSEFLMELVLDASRRMGALVDTPPEEFEKIKREANEFAGLIGSIVEKLQNGQANQPRHRGLRRVKFSMPAPDQPGKTETEPE